MTRPLWKKIRQTSLANEEMRIRILDRMISFYQAAVRLWPPTKGADVSTVLMAIHRAVNSG